jgi:ubiquinone/menaquinone biosynthesis C-methylase UbiE
MDKNEMRKKYMRDIYSKYWITAREGKYKDLPYDKNLIGLLGNLNIRGSVLEIAIGTGIPFGRYFYKKKNGFKGIDISPRLIKECRRLNPGIDAIVGDAEDLPFPDSYFSLTYCFHSTWYFPDISKAIFEMLRVTKKNGFIAFDIINLANIEIIRQNNKIVKRSRNKFYPIVHVIKKIIKSLMGISESWKFIISSTPTDPAEIVSLLKSHSLKIYGRASDESLILLDDLGENSNYVRLVFLVEK